MNVSGSSKKIASERERKRLNQRRRVKDDDVQVGETSGLEVQLKMALKGWMRECASDIPQNGSLNKHKQQERFASCRRRVRLKSELPSLVLFGDRWFQVEATSASARIPQSRWSVNHQPERL